MPYNHQDIEKKWQERWEQTGVFHARDDSDKPKFYCLIEFPYPSGAGLHIGHPRSYTALDVVARKRRMEGYNVLYPIGWDAFGLPTENYAIKTGRPPQEVTAENVATFRRQLKSLGFSFDWSREVNTTDPEYYKWTQWMFLEFFRAGLAYKKNMPINWCLSCKIGLANEEVVDGKCERCGGETEKRDKEQWMIAITKYADRLLEDLDTVDYLEKIKVQQRNWIGKSEGAEIAFQLPNFPTSQLQHLKVFTTRPDTLFGATFLVVSPECARSWVEAGWEASEEVRAYVETTLARTEMDRTNEDREKTGVDTGVKAINPANGEEIPVWVADYVLGAYGTGAIMAVPAHDERDFAFARKYGLPVRQVIQAVSPSYLVIEKSLPPEQVKELSKFGSVVAEKETKNWGKFLRVTTDAEREEELLRFLETHLLESSDDGGAWYADSVRTTNICVYPKYRFSLWDERGVQAFKEHGLSVGIPAKQVEIEAVAYAGDGKLVNSGDFNGMSSEEAKWAITEKVGGERKVQYKLRDWVFSRQRYWGEPIPLVWCDKCGWVPVPDDRLPVVLPVVEKYEPTDTGESPLAAMTDWVNTTCPQCGEPAKRETDTMPNWAGSSWYFLAYVMKGVSRSLTPSTSSGDKDDSRHTMISDYHDALKHWMPVDWYNGGMEHTTLHLLYSRFWNKFLFDQGHTPTSEPYAKRTSHGLILAEDGTKMSKSKGNVVNPDEMVDQYGADAVRLYELFMGPFGEPVPWSMNGLVGMRRFLEKVVEMGERADKAERAERAEVVRALHKTIKKVSDDIEAMRFNTAVSTMMVFVNRVKEHGGITKDDFATFLRLLCPFAPHLANELYEQLGGTELLETLPWPSYDPALAKDDVVEIGVQVNGKLRGTIQAAPDASEEVAVALALQDANVQKYLEERSPKKVIYIAGRIINLIV